MSVFKLWNTSNQPQTLPDTADNSSKTKELTEYYPFFKLKINLKSDNGVSTIAYTVFRTTKIKLLVAVWRKHAPI